jgi:hypothetical protein
MCRNGNWQPTAKFSTLPNFPITKNLIESGVEVKVLMYSLAQKYKYSASWFIVSSLADPFIKFCLEQIHPRLHPFVLAKI